MPAKILCVDDDNEFREELSQFLDDYEVIQASGGDEALAILKRPNSIDLVILDVMLPGANGTEVLRRIKSMDPGLGIIILTGHSSKDVAVQALKGHADEYVEKSYDIGRLKTVIRRLLENKKGNAAKDDHMSKVDIVKSFLLRNRDKKTTLEDAAMAVSLSPKYLSRIFYKKCGVSFVQFRRGVKLQEAKKLLTDSHLNINQIALRLGYKNSESFIRMFKKSTGLPPMHYKRNAAGRPQRSRK